MNDTANIINMEWNEKVLSMPKIPRGDEGEPAALREILLAISNGESPKKSFRIEGSSSSATLDRLAEALRPVGLVLKKNSQWELSEYSKVWLKTEDKFYITAFLCSRIVFMGELLHSLQEPKTISDLVHISKEEYQLSWRTKSEINNRLRWFRDVNYVEFIDFKNQYLLTEEGKQFLNHIEIVEPEALKTSEKDQTVGESEVNLSAWAKDLCSKAESNFSNRKSSIGYIVGGKYEMEKTIIGYLRFIGESRSQSEIREYSKNLYSVKSSSVSAFLSLLNNLGFINRITRSEYSVTDLGRKYLEEGSIIDLIACIHSSFLFVLEILQELNRSSLNNKELAAIAKSSYGFNRESVEEMNSRIIMLENAKLIREESLHKYTITHRGSMLLNLIPVQRRFVIDENDTPLNDNTSQNPVCDSIITELRIAARDSVNPDRLEKAVKKAFEFLGFNAKWIGHAGNTDVLITSVGPVNSVYKVAIDAKATSSGEITDGLVDFDTLKEHKNKHVANYNAIVGAKFTNNRLTRRAEEHNVALIDVDTIDALIRMHSVTPVTMEAYRRIFDQKGIVDISVLKEETDTLERYGILIRLVAICLIKESTDEITSGILSVREIYRSVRDSEMLKKAPTLNEIEDVLEFLASPVIKGIKKLKDGYQALISLEDICKKLSFYSRYYGQKEDRHDD